MIGRYPGFNFETVKYIVDGYPLKMLIQTPKNKSIGLLDVIFEIHGGGFVMGNEDFLLISRSYFDEDDTNYVLFSPEYRLAPEYPFPNAPEDTYKALKWVKEHAKDYGGNPDRIIVGGSSAGGNLAAVVSIMARDDKNFNPKPLLQILHIPGVDFHFNTPSTITYLDTPIWNTYLSFHSRFYYVPNPEDWKDYRASPLYASSHKGLPPAFIIADKYDSLYDDGVNYYNILKKSGVPAEFYSFEAYHGAESFFWKYLGLYKKEIMECRELMKKFISKNTKK